MTFKPFKTGSISLIASRAGDQILLPRELAHSLGLNVAMVYVSIIDRYLELKNKDPELVSSDGFFVFTARDLEAETGLSYGQQKRAIEKLVSLGLIEKKVKDTGENPVPMPKYRHFRVLENREVLSGLLKEGREKIEELTE